LNLNVCTDSTFLARSKISDIYAQASSKFRLDLLTNRLTISDHWNLHKHLIVRSKDLIFTMAPAQGLPGQAVCLLELLGGRFLSMLSSSTEVNEHLACLAAHNNHHQACSIQFSKSFSTAN
jgi:hypothetical protein